eukprot:4052917-Prymnesium_polylepis.1
MTETLVHKIEFDTAVNPPRATGVWIEHVGCTAREGCKRLLTARAVLLSAGAIQTPQLLMLSGLGPPVQLAQAGVRSTVPNEQVGQNFIDRQILSFSFLVKHHVSQMGVEAIGRAPDSKGLRGAFFEATAGGREASEFAKATAAFLPPKERGEWAIDLMRLIFSVHGIEEAVDQAMQIVALQEAPESRGEITLDGADATRMPRVNGAHLTSANDVVEQHKALQSLLALLNTSALRPNARQKLDISLPFGAQWPGALDCLVAEPAARSGRALVVPCLPHRNATHDTVTQWLRDNALSSYHYFGTAALGSVVDPVDFSAKG